MNGVNLIPASRLEAAAGRSRARAWLAVIAGAVVVCSAGAVVFRTLWSFDSGPLQVEIAAARASIKSADAKVLGLRGEIANLKRAELATRMVGEHPDWSVLLGAINQVRGDSVALDALDLTLNPPPPPRAPAPGETTPPPTPRAVERYTLRIRGIGTDLARVMAFVERLEKLRVLESVAMKQSRIESGRGVSVTGFDLECTLAESDSLPFDKGPPAASANASGKEDER